MAIYLVLNVVVIGDAMGSVIANPALWSDWTTALTQQHGSPLVIVVGIALLVFPKLALGLSGFETGVAVMPLINSGAPTTRPRDPTGRIRGAKHAADHGGR